MTGLALGSFIIWVYLIPYSPSEEHNVSATVLKVFGALLCLAWLAACSDDSSVASGGNLDQPAPNQSRSVSSASVSLELGSYPIDREEFLGLTKRVPAEPEPCPFLSDATALGTAKRSDKLVRRRTSNQECYWSRNLGFSVRVEVEPLANAKPLKDRAYNMDSPPIFQSQPGPGANATVLLDTVWDSSGRPYAMGFEQDNQLVTIYVTGLSTDVERLVTTAKEVAMKLPNAPTIEPGFDEPQRYDLCSLWSAERLGTAVGHRLQAETQSDQCNWVSADASIKLGLYSARDFPFDSLISQGATELPNLGLRAILHQQRQKGSRPAAAVLDMTLSENKMINLQVSRSIANSDAVAVELAKNLSGRL